MALRCMAAWVRVPWRKLEALERMAALQVNPEAVQKLSDFLSQKQPLSTLHIL